MLESAAAELLRILERAMSSYCATEPFRECKLWRSISLRLNNEERSIYPCDSDSGPRIELTWLSFLPPSR